MLDPLFHYPSSHSSLCDERDPLFRRIEASCPASYHGVMGVRRDDKRLLFRRSSQSLGCPQPAGRSGRHHGHDDARTMSQFLNMSGACRLVSHAPGNRTFLEEGSPSRPRFSSRSGGGYQNCGAAHLEQLTDEVRFQLSGRVGDDSVVRVGRWLGADSLVLFRIDGPTWRERLLARMHGKMPPFVVSSKIISLESGEVLYYDTTAARSRQQCEERDDSDHQLRPAIHAGLDQALSTAILHFTSHFVKAPPLISAANGSQHILCGRRSCVGSREVLASLSTIASSSISPGANPETTEQGHGRTPSPARRAGAKRRQRQRK